MKTLFNRIPFLLISVAFLAAQPVRLLAAAYDVSTSQKNTTDNAWKNVIFSPVASGVWTFDSSKNPTSTATTGTGSIARAIGPTFTGTIGAASLSLSSLTSGRVPYASTAGLLTDSATLSFDAGTGALSIGSNAANGSLQLTTPQAILTIIPNVISGANGVSYNTSFVNGGNGPHVFFIGGVEAGRITATGTTINSQSGAVLTIIPDNTSGANGVTYATSFISGGSGPHVFTVGATESVRFSTTGISVKGTSTVTGIRTATGSNDFGTITTASTASTTVTVTGAAVGDSVSVNTTDGSPWSSVGGVVAEANVTATNTVQVRVVNATSSSVVVGTRTFRVTVTSF